MLNKQKMKGSGTMFFLASIIVLIFFFYVGDALRESRLETFKKNPPETTLDQKVLVDKFKLKPEITLVSGIYQAKNVVGGHTFEYRYYFSDDKTLTKSVVAEPKGIKLNGSAKYRMDGSVLVYSEITGDRVLFPEIGEPISVVGVGIIEFHDPKGNTRMVEANVLEVEMAKKGHAE